MTILRLPGRKILAFLLCSPFVCAAQPGAIDAVFAAAVQSSGGASPSVLCVTSDATGNVYIGGSFSQFGGVPADRVAKLFADGTLDAAFTSTVGLVGNDVKAIAVQSDGKILIGGNFTSVGGVPRTYLARLNADGSLDEGFAPSLNLPVFCLALQADGSIIVGGQFFSPGFTRRGLVRLFTDGTIDPSFNTGAGANNTVYDLDIDPSGLIAIAGAFTSYGGVSANHVLLLDGTGSVHAGFVPGLGLDGPAYAIETFTGGRILVGGEFDQVNGTPSPALACLAYDGTLHPGMTTTGFSTSASVVAIVDDINGLPLIGGSFSAYAGQPRSMFLRLLADGTLDASFDVGSGFAGTVVSDLVSDPSGQVLATGTFSGYRGTPQNGVTRVQNCALATYYLDADGDGLGDPASPQAACAAPSNHVLNSSDCDDADADILGQSMWYEDGDGDGRGNSASSLLSCAGLPGYVLDNTDCDDTNGELYPGAACDDGDPRTVSDELTANCVCAGQAVDVAAKVFLGGPLNGTLMNDGLRSAGLIPLTEPYTLLNFHPNEAGGGEQIAASVLAVTGPDAIVDWVMMRLRGDQSPYEKQQLRMALLQRDGDIVDLDGLSPVRFALQPGSYVLEVHHRNHLGIMSTQSMPPTPTGTPISVDLTLPATPCYGSSARKQVGEAMALWPGNSLLDHRIAFTGSGNDRDRILVAVGSTTPNNLTTGQYRLEDINLDGVVKFTGTGNDRDPILVTVGSTTPNNIRLEQVP